MREFEDTCIYNVVKQSNYVCKESFINWIGLGIFHCLFLGV